MDAGNRTQVFWEQSALSHLSILIQFKILLSTSYMKAGNSAWRIWELTEVSPMLIFLMNYIIEKKHQNFYNDTYANYN